MQKRKEFEINGRSCLDDHFQVCCHVPQALSESNIEMLKRNDPEWGGCEINALAGDMPW